MLAGTATNACGAGGGRGGRAGRGGRGKEGGRGGEIGAGGAWGVSDERRVGVTPRARWFQPKVCVAADGGVAPVPPDTCTLHPHTHARDTTHVDIADMMQRAKTALERGVGGITGRHS